MAAPARSRPAPRTDADRIRGQHVDHDLQARGSPISTSGAPSATVASLSCTTRSTAPAHRRGHSSPLPASGRSVRPERRARLRELVAGLVPAHRARPAVALGDAQRELARAPASDGDAPLAASCALRRDVGLRLARARRARSTRAVARSTWPRRCRRALQLAQGARVQQRRRGGSERREHARPPVTAIAGSRSVMRTSRPASGAETT